MEEDILMLALRFLVEQYLENLGVQAEVRVTSRMVMAVDRRQRMGSEERTTGEGMTESAARAYIAALTYGERVQLRTFLGRMEDCVDLRDLREPRQTLASQGVEV